MPDIRSEWYNEAVMTGEHVTLVANPMPGLFKRTYTPARFQIVLFPAAALINNGRHA